MNTVADPLHNLQQSDANVSKHKIKSQAIGFYVKPVKRRKENSMRPTSSLQRPWYQSAIQHSNRFIWQELRVLCFRKMFYKTTHDGENVGVVFTWDCETINFFFVPCTCERISMKGKYTHFLEKKAKI